MEEWVNNCVHHLSDECPFCGKQSYNFSHLRDHKYAQSGVGSDLCPHCHKKFRRFTVQKQFMFVKPKHNESGIGNTQGLVDEDREINASPHQPDVQPSHEQYLYTQLREFGYSCHYCREVFRSFEKLRQHVLIHTQVKPHVCPYCNKTCHWSEANKTSLGPQLAETIHACDHCRKQHCQPRTSLNQNDIHSTDSGHCNKGINTNRHLHDHVYMKKCYQLKASRGGKGAYQPMGLSPVKGAYKFKAAMTVGPETSALKQEPSTVSMENRESFGVPPPIVNGNGSGSTRFVMTPGIPLANQDRNKESPSLTSNLKDKNAEANDNSNDSVAKSKGSKGTDNLVQLVFVVPKGTKTNVCIKQGNKTRKLHTFKYSTPKIDQSQKVYLCYKCNKAFGSLLSLKRHVFSHTSDWFQSKKDFQSSPRQTEKGSIPRQYACKKCGKKFNHFFILRAHLKTHENEKFHVCPQCKKVFATCWRLKVHLRTHTGERPFKCPHCDKRFSVKANMQMHINTHTGNKPYLCAQCGKASASQSGLHIHMMSHTKEQKYLCQYCGKGFRYPVSLKTHVYTHTGERPFKCRLCGKGFTQAAGLKTHMNNHTGNHPHTCHQCGKGFNHITSLKEHMAIHTGHLPHICGHCGKGYFKPNHLKVHMYSHSGERPHVCPECGKRFIGAAYLKVHMYAHRGVKPFPCPHCSRGLNQLSLLKQHITKAHEGQSLYSGCTVCVSGFAEVPDLIEHMSSHRKSKIQN